MQPSQGFCYCIGRFRPIVPCVQLIIFAFGEEMPYVKVLLNDSLCIVGFIKRLATILRWI